MLMINSPHNPSGAMFTADDIAELTALLRGTGIYLLSDEVYEHIVFDGARHESVLRYPELRERAFVVSSFGKTYHCTGWKLGYCIAPPALSAEFRKVHQYNTFCTFAPAQWAFAEMIEAEPEHYEQLGAFYQAKRDRFREQLLTTQAQAAAGAGRLFPAGRLFRGQRPRRRRVLPLADDREGRGRDSAVAVLRNRRRRASAWRACASPRTRRRWMRRSSGCRSSVHRERRLVATRAWSRDHSGFHTPR